MVAWSGGAVPSPEIGDPGRAALEIAPGPPVRPAGRADIELSSVCVHDLTVRAATVRGVMHRRRGEPRQDAFALASIDASPDNGDLVIAVCDGVGEFADSHLAADRAAERTVELARARGDWTEIVGIVNEEVAETDCRSRQTANDRCGAATTVAAARITKAEQAWLVSGAWVGDSSIWLLDRQGNWTCVSHPESSADIDDYYSTAVRALPARDVTPELVEFSLLDGAVFVLSDGIGNPLAWTSEVKETLAAWWAMPPDPFMFGMQVGFARRGHLDDRTAVGVWLPMRQSPGAGQ